MDLLQSHADVAWGNFTASLSTQAPKLEAFAKSLYAPLGRMGQTLSDLLNNRWLDTAVGEQLDGVGVIVGQSRFIDQTVFTYFFGFSEQPYTTGFEQARFRDYWEQSAGGSTRLSDEAYRRVLYWKIAVNNGHGTGPEIGQALRGIFATDLVRIQNMGNAKIRIFIGRRADPTDPILSTAERWIPKLAGVGLQVLMGGDPENTFGFLEQGLAGFEVGSFADDIA